MLKDLYTQKGEAALGVKKDSSIFDKSIQRIYNMLNSAKKVHSDIMQNIDNKFTRGMDDAFKSLNNVNGDKKPYESKYTKKIRLNISKRQAQMVLNRELIMIPNRTNYTNF